MRERPHPRNNKKDPSKMTTKKTVSYKGENKKVLFSKINHQREVHSKDGCGRIKHATGSVDFIINGKTYPVTFEVRLKNKHSVTYTFEGLNFPDNEKRIIEHIIKKYGI